MVAGGVIDCACYTEKPQDSKEKIGGRVICEWEPQTPTNKNVRSMVVIVGAENHDGKKSVYFTNPTQDGSNPNNPTMEKTYRISYTKFCELIEGFNMANNQSPGYLFYNPHLIQD
jgi:hypothetical protein